MSSVMLQQLSDAVDTTVEMIGHGLPHIEAKLEDCLKRGVRMFNRADPVTKWSVKSVPKVFQHYVVANALWWFWKAQPILSLDFEYNGQTVSIKHTRRGAIAKLLKNLDKQLVAGAKDKKTLKKEKSNAKQTRAA
jgi:hypothetical protein